MRDENESLKFNDMKIGKHVWSLIYQLQSFFLLINYILYSCKDVNFCIYYHLFYICSVSEKDFVFVNYVICTDNKKKKKNG